MLFTLTSAYILSYVDDMRAWLINTFPDGNYTMQSLSPTEICSEITKHYPGGIDSFINAQG
jgi:hypothetical protein